MARETLGLIKRDTWPVFIIQLKFYLLCTSLIATVCVIECTGALLDYCKMICQPLYFNKIT